MLAAMIDEDTLVEMEERAAKWEFGEGFTRSAADARVCEEYGVKLEDFLNAINARDSGRIRNSGDKAA